MADGAGGPPDEAVSGGAAADGQAVVAPPAVAVRRVDLDPRTIVAAGTAVLGLIAAFGFVRATTRTLTWLIIGTLLALALEPLVGRAERGLRVRRGVAVGLVLGGFLALVTAFVVAVGPPAVREARAFSRDLPEVLESLGTLPVIGDDLRDNDVPAKVQEWIETLPERLSGNTEGLTDAAGSIAGGLLAAVFTTLITVVLLLDGERVVRTARRAVPLRLRPRADRFGALLFKVVGRYFAGSLLVAVLSGTVNLAVGLALGVPLAPVAAVWVAVTNLIPQIGGAAGGIPFVLLGLTESPTKGLICAAYFLTYQQFENHVVQPAIVGDAVDLSPPVTMLAALVGASTAGVPGALVAVPIMGVAKAIALELRPPAVGRRSTDEPLTERPGVLARLVGRARRRRRRPHGPRPGGGAGGS